MFWNFYSISSTYWINSASHILTSDATYSICWPTETRNNQLNRHSLTVYKFFFLEKRLKLTYMFKKNLRCRQYIFNYMQFTFLNLHKCIKLNVNFHHIENFWVQKCSDQRSIIRNKEQGNWVTRLVSLIIKYYINIG